MKYDIILIDLDETIFDFKMAEKMALGKTIKAFGLEPTEEVISRYHVINRGLWRQLEEGTVTHQQVLEDRFGNLFAAFGKAVDKAACGAAYGDGLSERHYWLPGAEEALENFAELEKLRRSITAKLRTVCQLDIPVKFVSPNTLRRFEGKAKRVIDLRKM